MTVQKLEDRIMGKKRVITAALPYINNIPHLGHIVGSHLPADIFARYSRLKGYDVVFVGGTDEHGTPAELAAKSIGISLKEFSDVISQKHKEIYDWFEISYDNFSRTSRPIHHETTLEFFKVLYDKGFISEGEIEQFYSETDKRFLPDRYVIGTCPKCGFTEATGDQCEKCTSVLDPKELIEPRSKISGTIPEIRKTKHLFLDIDKLETKLEHWLKENPLMRSQVKNLALGWIKEGLKKRCITRDLENGVKVPIKGYENKVFYVWFDAPIGYISATKEATSDWKNYWENPECEVYHYLGKDNIPFHTIFWPGMLLAHGTYQLPHNVIGLQNLNFEGQKFSKSKRVGVFCEKLIGSDLDPDILRAYLTKIIPETSDSEFKWDDFKDTINSELVNNYGNFVNRTSSFLYNKLGGYVVKPTEEEIGENERELLRRTIELKDEIGKSLEKGFTREAYTKFLELSSEGNKYMHESAPWKIAKEDLQKARKVLYTCMNFARDLAVLSEPFIPNSSQKVWGILNLEGKVNEPRNWDNVGTYKLSDGHKINEPYILFKKIEDTDVSMLRERLSHLSDLEVWFK